MSNFIAPKDYIDALVTLIRSDTTLGDYPVRVGPQPAFNIAKDKNAMICVYLMGMDEEEPFTANNSKNYYNVGILIAVKDDENDADTVEELRYDLLEAMQNLLAQNRSLDCGAKSTLITNINLGIVDLDEKNQQIYRFAEINIKYWTLRSHQPEP